MAREKGVIGLSGAFETQSAMPLDARMVVDTLADLILVPTWTANDGGVYAYAGMVVTVRNDPTPANNGPYWLSALPYTNPANWIKTGSGSSGVTGTPTRLGALDIDGAINLVNTDISLYQVPALTYLTNIRIIACNRNYSTPVIRIAHVDGAIGAVASEDYIFYDVILQPYETKTLDLDGMVPIDSILVRSDAVGVTFMALGWSSGQDYEIKRLAAVSVIASTNTALFVATAETIDVSIVVCNKDSTSTVLVRLAIIDGALGLWAVEDYILFDEILLENETKVYSLGLIVPIGYTIGVWSNNVNVSFIAYGREQ